MKPSQTPDEWLMGQVVRGHRDALDILVRRYASPLLTFITRMTGDRHQGEELFQEAFLAVWVNRRRFDAHRRFKPWLYRIAINKCRAAFRRRSIPIRQSYSDDNPSLDLLVGSVPDGVSVATDTGCLVEAAVSALPEKQRAVLVLRNWSGLSYGEIAEILGRREATVRSNMHHALAALRAYLEPRMK